MTAYTNRIACKKTKSWDMPQWLYHTELAILN